MALLDARTKARASPAFLQEAEVAVLKVTASWCGPCKRIQPCFRDLCSRYPNVEVFELDVSEAADDSESGVLLSALDVSGVPTFISFRGGVEVARYAGISEDQLALLFATAQSSARQDLGEKRK